MGRFRSYVLTLLLVGLAAGASARMSPRDASGCGPRTPGPTQGAAPNWCRQDGAVATERNTVDETWDRVTLILTGNVTWRYRDGVPFEMKEDCRVSCSGKGGLRNLTRYVTRREQGR